MTTTPCYDNAIPVIPTERKEHTQSRPFCDHSINPDCCCREDLAGIQTLDEYVQEGLMTLEEALRTYEGKMFT